MAAKQLVFSEDARRRLQKGIDTVARAVATTLGPKGRNVARPRSSQLSLSESDVEETEQD